MRWTGGEGRGGKRLFPVSCCTSCDLALIPYLLSTLFSLFSFVSLLLPLSLFGKAGSDYDFKARNAAEASRDLTKMQDEQAKLSKQINKKVMSMFEKYVVVERVMVREEEERKGEGKRKDRADRRDGEDSLSLCCLFVFLFFFFQS